MLLYWGLLAIITFNTGIAYWIKNVYLQRITLFISFLLMFVLAAFRKDIGVDYPNYLFYYRYFEADVTLPKDMEIGYSILNRICVSTGLGFDGVIIITSFLSYFPVYVLARKIEKPLVLYAYFLLYYPMTYALVRQCVGMSFAVVSTYYFLQQFYPDETGVFNNLLKKGKKKTSLWLNIKIVVLGLLAISFHNAFVLYYALLLLCYFVRLDTKKVLPVIFVVLAVGFIATPILNFLISHFSEGSYNRYFSGGSSSAILQKRQTGSGLGMLLRYGIYCVSFLLITSHLKKRSDNERTAFNLMFVAIIGFDALSLSSQIFLRLKFIFLAAYLIPLFYHTKFSKRNKDKFYFQTACFVVILLYGIFFRFRNEMIVWENIPYKSIFW